MDHANTHPLIAKLGSIAVLSEKERQALAALPMQVRELRADQDIVREGDRPTRCCLLIEGFACRYSTTDKGKRMILSFHIPGEVADLQGLHLGTLDHSPQTLTRCKVGFIEHEALQDLCDRHPRLAGAFWRETLIDGAIFQEWMINIGRREAYARACHLLCEMMTRTQAVGLARDQTCVFPATQGELGDAMGISHVHTNRTLQEIKAAGLVHLKTKVLTVLDWEGLKRAGEFDPTYLHLVSGHQAAGAAS